MKEYMQTFIWIMLFAIVVEMIFPDSDYKKYLKLVLGCIIIYTLIKPAIHFIPMQEKTYNDFVCEYQDRLTQGTAYEEAERSVENQIEKQQTFLKAAFEENIKKVIEKEIDISVQQIDIEWSDDKEGAVVEKIYLVIDNQKAETEGKINIPKVRIGEKSNSLGGDNEKLKIKIKTCLKNFYNVPSCNIYITVQKN